MTDLAPGSVPHATPVRSLRMRRLVRTFRRQPKLAIGAAIVAVFLFVGVFGPLLISADPNQQNLAGALQSPQWFGGEHFLGTDLLGRDVFARMVYGARVSLLIAAAVVLLSGSIGLLLGVVSGYFGGWIDLAIQKIVEVVWAFPALLLAIIIVAFQGGGLVNLIVALSAQRWIAYCRVSRGDTIAVRHREFVMAATLIGAPTRRIIMRHVLPSLLPSMMIVSTFSMATAIIAEASLSFLGLGVPPNVPTWGAMLANGRTYVTTNPSLTIFPGLAILITILGINLLGDGLRDILDPKLRK